MNCYDSGWRWNVFFLPAPALLPVNARSACVPRANQSGAVGAVPNLVTLLDPYQASRRGTQVLPAPALKCNVL